MGDDLQRALLALDRELLGQNLRTERVESLAVEVRDLNAKVRSFSAEHLDFYDDPSSFLAMLRQAAWKPPSPNDR